MVTYGFLPNLGLPELILIIALALIIFGPAKLPEVGKAMGKSIKEFKSAMAMDSGKINVEEEKVDNTDI